MHMGLGGEAVGEQIGEGDRLDASVFSYQVDEKIILAEFPHYLTAHAAGREKACENAILSAADGNCLELPFPIVHRLEEGASLGADRGGEGGIFDVAALVHPAVFAQ